MPFSGPDDPKLPRSVLQMEEQDRRQWVAVWNEVFEDTEDEGRAFAAANAVVMKISKIDEEQRMVFGWANISIRKDGKLITDLHGDQIDPATLEKAAHKFVLEFRDAGVMHTGEAVGQLVESFFVTPEKLEMMGLSKSDTPVGWWVGFRVNPETFAKVKDGTFRMFSIQGAAQKVEVADDAA